ncbi:uncharacterized protein isoform X2 [Rhodnius prolixus]
MSCRVECNNVIKIRINFYMHKFIEDKEGKKSVTFNGAVVVIDSENDSDDNYNLTAEAFASKCVESRHCNPRFNSLLHKKLRESNCKLHEDTADQVKSSYRFAVEQLREISSRLLEAQVETQDTQKNLRSSLIAMERIDWALNDLTSIPFMQNVNLKL